MLSSQLWWNWLQWASFFRFLLLKSYLAFLSFEAEQWLEPSSEASVFALGKSSFFTVDLDFDTFSTVFFPWVGVGKGFFITMKRSCDHPPLLSSVLSRPFSVPKIPSALFFSPQNYRNILRRYRHKYTEYTKVCYPLLIFLLFTLISSYFSACSCKLIWVELGLTQEQRCFLDFGRRTWWCAYSTSGKHLLWCTIMRWVLCQLKETWPMAFRYLVQLKTV